MDKKRGIGRDNKLPWPRLHRDMQYFHDQTVKARKGMMNAVVMGRKTWESLPKAHRPLEGRLNVVLSRQELDLPDGVLKASSFEGALKILDEREDVDKIWVIGGANVFEQAMKHPGFHQLFLTEIQDVFECDSFFPEFDSEHFHPFSASKIYQEDGIKFRFLVIEKVDG